MTTSPRPSAPSAARLRPADLAALASIGLRTRKLRATLSALGIAIGVAAIVAVLGLAASAKAFVLNELNQLGTNLLTVTNGQTFSGATAELPVAAPGMIRRLTGVTAVQDTGTVNGVNAYKSPLIPPIETNGLSVDPTTLDLPAVSGTSVAQGRFLNAVTAREPVAVLGLARSSQAGLLNEISQLGTNLLTVTNGQTLTGENAKLPTAAPRMIGRLRGVTAVEDTGTVSGVNVYKSPLIPPVETNALSVDAATLGLPAVAGTSLAQGRFLNAATAREPIAVLGAAAAQRLGIDRIRPGMRIWVGGQWFYVTGILNPDTYAPEIDSAVLIGFPAAEKYLNFDGHPSHIYVRTVNTQAATTAVDNLLAYQANPENPNQVDVSRPSDALTAQADAKGALDTLFLGLGGIALLIGAIGVANIMVIAVLERRQEIGLRRALGATKGQIRTQFLAEAILLSLAGDADGGAGDAAR